MTTTKRRHLLRRQRREQMIRVVVKRGHCPARENHSPSTRRDGRERMGRRQEKIGELDIHGGGFALLIEYSAFGAEVREGDEE